MLALLLSISLAVTPDANVKAALADLTVNVAPESRHATRYLDLSAVPGDQRPKFLGALAIALNSTSTSSQFYKPLVVGDLVRIDLEALGWDKNFRTEELKRLAESGVNFVFGNNKVRARFTDIWEDFAQADPYFRVPAYGSRGWVDPAAEITSSHLAGTSKLLLRADWLLPRLLLEAKDGGYYSQLLLLPTSEADLYKRFGQDIKVIERFNQLRHGGATVGPSIVALHNRELQEIPSAFGYDFRYIWRTFDFATDADDPTKNVFRSLAGSAKHDGREIIGTLPNGLHWYYLSDGAGRQANVVPQNIALDQRNKRGITNPNVTNAIKCMDCHMPVSGIYPFQDSIRGAVISPEIGLAVIARNNEIQTEFVPVIGPPPAQPKLQIKYVDGVDDALKAQVTNRAKDLEEYYLSDLTARIAQQQDSYGRRITACNGLDTVESASIMMSAFNRYHEDLVTAEQAIRELGVPFDEAIALLRASGNQDLILLSNGQKIRRAAWEKGYGDAMRVTIYPWERIAK